LYAISDLYFPASGCFLDWKARERKLITTKEKAKEKPGLIRLAKRINVIIRIIKHSIIRIDCGENPPPAEAIPMTSLNEYPNKSLPRIREVDPRYLINAISAIVKKRNKAVNPKFAIFFENRNIKRNGKNK
jgi:hypothetical protein